ncbi:hypothetical protein HBB16_00865 [Pseudonocardia sp. MCCB 268]|nr:hypothetical protein [Pseudonocardia cytotoxica]
MIAIGVVTAPRFFRVARSVALVIREETWHRGGLLHRLPHRADRADPRAAEQCCRR